MHTHTYTHIHTHTVHTHTVHTSETAFALNISWVSMKLGPKFTLTLLYMYNDTAGKYTPKGISFPLNATPWVG